MLSKERWVRGVERLSGAEKLNPPIVIRGHHLDRIQQAFQTSPSQTAESYAAAIKRNFTSWDKKDQEYARDVMGTPENYDNFRKNIEKVFKQIVNAPNDQPIYLVSGQPDGMCGACVAGQHCQMKIHSGYVNVINYDNSYLLAFLTTARQLGENPEMIVSQRNFSDSPSPENVRTLKSDKRTLKRVMRDGLHVYQEFLQDPFRNFS